MAAPILTSISPMSGLAVGDVFVQISGSGFNLAAVGTVTVTFGGVPAIRVGVVSSSLVMAVAPPGDPDAGSTPGAVDVTVANVTPQTPPALPLVEPATLVKAFTYKRPSIAIPEDFSGHSAVSLVTRTLVSEFRRAVLKNVRHDMHPDYADAISATADQTTLAVLPSLKILGPRISEDRWNSSNEPTLVDNGNGSFTEAFMSTTAMLTYDIVGVGRDYAEVSNLWSEVQRYFDHNQFLSVTILSSKFGVEVAQYELEALWDQKGDFKSKATRQGIYQFTETFVVRGLKVTPDAKDWASMEATQVNATYFQKPVDQITPLDGIAVENLEVILPNNTDLSATLKDLESRLERVEADDPAPIYFTYATPSPLQLGTLSSPEILENVKVVITDPFDGVATILVGTNVTPDLVFSAGEINPGFAGEYANDQAFKISASVNFLLTITPGASTRGSGYVLYRVRR